MLVVALFTPVANRVMLTLLIKYNVQFKNHQKIAKSTMSISQYICVNQQNVYILRPNQPKRNMFSLISDYINDKYNKYYNWQNFNEICIWPNVYNQVYVRITHSRTHTHSQTHAQAPTNASIHYFHRNNVISYSNCYPVVPAEIDTALVTQCQIQSLV